MGRRGGTLASSQSVPFHLNSRRQDRKVELFFPIHIKCHQYKKTTLKCLSIGTPKTINFPFVSNGKLMVFRCPNIQAHYNEAVIYLNFGTPKNNEFSIWNKWKINYFRCPNT